MVQFKCQLRSTLYWHYNVSILLSFYPVLELVLNLCGIWAMNFQIFTNSGKFCLFYFEGIACSRKDLKAEPSLICLNENHVKIASLGYISATWPHVLSKHLISNSQFGIKMFTE